MIVFDRSKVKAKDAAFHGKSLRSAAGRAFQRLMRCPRNVGERPVGRLLHCIKFDTQRARINPNAKKYQSAVSFLVAAIALGV
ncbi:hypothetical protein [Paraburkholderia diazotrophica]|uniref:hypothetical protein n=1 Tax=Paraburkholderia diazotrophica TaxID=667676 RepID=UPI000B844D42|nr:hypothetical protein [Paraburkholderia diazotrophica]